MFHLLPAFHVVLMRLGCAAFLAAQGTPTLLGMQIAWSCKTDERSALLVQMWQNVGGF